MNVARKVQIDFFHRNDLCVSASAGSAFYAETGTQRRFAEREHRFFADTVERIGKPYRNGRLALPRARRRYGGNKDETSARSFVRSAFLQSAKRFCTELCFVNSERFDPVRINPDALCDVRDRKHSIFLCYFDIRQHSVIIRANAGLCKSFGTL